MNKSLLKHFIKTILFIAGTFIYGFFGLLLVLFLPMSLGSSNIHLVPLTIIVIISLVGVWIFVFITLFLPVKKKLIYITFSSFILIVGLTILGFSVHNNHIQSIRLEDRGVDLNEYRPFQDSDKLARLDSNASLTLNSDLPRLDGATALYPVYAAFTEAVYPEGDYNPYHYYGEDASLVISSQTGSAYNRLINNETDIIFVAGPSEEQRKSAQDKGITLDLTPIGKEAFVFFVHADNPVNSLTVEEIQKIYTGEITNWQEVGGNNETIRPFQRPNGSGSQTALLNLMQGLELMVPPKEDVVGGMGGIITQTASYRNHKNAIGFSFRHFSMEMVEEDSIKHVALNDIYPTKASIADGSYPVAASFYAVTAGSTNPNIDLFIKWILTEEGQLLIELSGYVPIN